jgi:hypothetical protein
LSQTIIPLSQKDSAEGISGFYGNSFTQYKAARVNQIGTGQSVIDAATGSIQVA